FSGHTTGSRQTHILVGRAGRALAHSSSVRTFPHVLGTAELPVLATSYFQEPTWDTLFAARIPADYCLHTPGQTSVWGVLVPWEVRCGVIRSRIRRKPRSRNQNICQ